MRATCEKQQTWLLRRFHTLCGKLGMTPDEKAQLIGALGVESSRDMNVRQLEEMCRKLDEQLNPDLAKLDRLRKQTMASIGGWLKTCGQPSDAARIKAIACRATEHKYFNSIPEERLRNVYHLFLKKQKDFRQVNRVVAEELERMTMMN